MNTQEQIKALAELDGYCFCRSEQSGGVEEWHDGDGELVFNLPNYLSSYDAIIPLIQRQPDLIKQRMDEIVRAQNSVKAVIELTPSQLADALLRATGKWKE